MPTEESLLRKRAEEIAYKLLVASKAGSGCRFRDSHSRHLIRWQDNLIEGVLPEDCEDDLRKGDGAELDDHGRSDKWIPAKFCAPHSSSALAANTFGPFRHFPKRLLLPHQRNFDDCRFEFPCDNGLRTKSRPNFDFFAQVTDGPVAAVESKFLEILDLKNADFKPRYDGPFRRSPVVEKQWQKVFEELKSEPETYKRLDAAQLVKHYLGLKVAYDRRPRVLLYVYWEPANAEDHKPFVAHRRELQRFASCVDGCETKFMFASYPDLWQQWKDTSKWPGMTAHLEKLYSRYRFVL
jgi:hypothetical protein